MSNTIICDKCRNLIKYPIKIDESDIRNENLWYLIFNEWVTRNNYSRMDIVNKNYRVAHYNSSEMIGYERDFEIRRTRIRAMIERVAKNVRKKELIRINKTGHLHYSVGYFYE